MTLVKLLESKTLPCGCVSGRYRYKEADQSLQEVVYIEEKGKSCRDDGHQPNCKLDTSR